eukprot:scaffold47814_cov44-Phaeocystis_antarctica.AAC.2
MISLRRLETVTACPAKGSAPPVSAVELLGESGVYFALVMRANEARPNDTSPTECPLMRKRMRQPLKACCRELSGGC